MWQLCVQVLVALRCVTQRVVLADGSSVVVAVAAFGAAAAACAKSALMSLCSCCWHSPLVHLWQPLLIVLMALICLIELQQLLVVAASVQMPLLVVLMTALSGALHVCDTWLPIMQVVAARQVEKACCYYSCGSLWCCCWLR